MAAAPPTGTRISASGRCGPGRRCSRRCAPMPSGFPASGSSAATPSPSSAPTGPRLYWSVMAAQMLGAMPVPVYADAVADELALCWPMPRCASPRWRTRSRSTRSCRSPSGCRSSSRSSTTSRAACATTTTAGCTRSTTSSGTAVPRWHRTPRLGAMARPRDRGGQGLGRFGHSLYFGHHRPVEGRRAVRHRLHQRGLRHGRLRQAHRARRGARLSAARLGRATTISTMRRRWSRASAWPVRRAPTPRWHDMREIGPTFYFAPPRVFEQMLTRVMIRMEDAGPIKRRLFHAFLGVARRYGEKILNRRAACRSAAACSMRWASFWSTGRSRTCSASRACASPIRRARRSGPTCSRSIARSG